MTLFYFRYHLANSFDLLTHVVKKIVFISSCVFKTQATRMISKQVLIEWDKIFRDPALGCVMCHHKTWLFEGKFYRLTSVQ